MLNLTTGVITNDWNKSDKLNSLQCGMQNIEQRTNRLHCDVRKQYISGRNAISHYKRTTAYLAKTRLDRNSDRQLTLSIFFSLG